MHNHNFTLNKNVLHLLHGIHDKHILQIAYLTANTSLRDVFSIKKLCSTAFTSSQICLFAH